MVYEPGTQVRLHERWKGYYKGYEHLLSFVFKLIEPVGEEKWRVEVVEHKAFSKTFDPAQTRTQRLETAEQFLRFPSVKREAELAAGKTIEEIAKIVRTKKKVIGSFHGTKKVPVYASVDDYLFKEHRYRSPEVTERTVSNKATKYKPNELVGVRYIFDEERLIAL